jgi:hypothetical protein
MPENKRNQKQGYFVLNAILTKASFLRKSFPTVHKPLINRSSKFFKTSLMVD